MSVLIKGMQMPQNCVHCELFHDEGFCIVTGTTVNMWGQKRNADCPLIELPDHGDLIERDAFRKTMYHDTFETDSDLQKWESGCWIRYKMFERNIESAPVIIPAERSDDETD